MIQKATKVKQFISSMDTVYLPHDSANKED